MNLVPDAVAPFRLDTIDKKVLDNQGLFRETQCLSITRRTGVQKNTKENITSRLSKSNPQWLPLFLW